MYYAEMEIKYCWIHQQAIWLGANQLVTVKEATLVVPELLTLSYWQASYNKSIESIMNMYFLSECIHLTAS